jgi:hypothetical protein
VPEGSNPALDLDDCPGLGFDSNNEAAPRWVPTCRIDTANRLAPSNANGVCQQPYARVIPSLGDYARPRHLPPKGAPASTWNRTCGPRKQTLVYAYAVLGVRVAQGSTPRRSSIRRHRGDARAGAEEALSRNRERLARKPRTSRANLWNSLQPRRGGPSASTSRGTLARTTPSIMTYGCRCSGLSA